MTRGLTRYYGNHDLHFITFSCYQRRPILDTPQRRDLLVQILEEERQKYRFVVHGYVVMPEHVHLLITEPEVGDPSVVLKVIKHRFSCILHARRKRTAEPQTLAARPPELIWQKRFYDFNIWSEKKRIEKLRYIHRNPVKRGLVTEPDQWKWSSFRTYFYGEQGPVRVNFQEWSLEIKRVPVQSFGGTDGAYPLIRRERE